MRARVALLLGLLVAAAVLVAVLSQSAPRRSGSNMVAASVFVVQLKPGQAACQGGTLIPGDTAAVEATIGTYWRPGPRVAVTIAAAGRRLASGGLAPGWRQGVVRIPVSRIARTTPDARVCIANGGPGKLAIGGNRPYGATSLTVGPAHGAGHAVMQSLHLDFYRPGSESWWSMLPTLWHRMSLAKGSIVRDWAPWGALVLVLITCGLACRALWRIESESESGA